MIIVSWIKIYKKKEIKYLIVIQEETTSKHVVP